jgi:methylenetetrahydrofolate reductase (NADPH)
MNKGSYLDDEITEGEPTDFCIGIAGYPEKHFESPSLGSDLAFTKAKIEAGANYIVTQMFFDTKHYFDYVKLCRDNGINVPIVPGIKPLTRAYQLTSIPRLFHVNMPEDLVEWCIQQSQELKAAGVPCLHYYTMGDAETIRRIVSEVA